MIPLIIWRYNLYTNRKSNKIVADDETKEASDNTTGVITNENDNKNDSNDLRASYHRTDHPLLICSLMY